MAGQRIQTQLFECRTLNLLHSELVMNWGGPIYLEFDTYFNVLGVCDPFSTDES